MKLIKKILWLAFLLFIAVVLVAIGYYYATTKNVRLDPAKLLLDDKTITVFDEYNTPVPTTAIFGQTVRIQELPEHTKNAFIATEDKRFYQHNGFDTRRILKAVWNNFRSRSFKEGASTISQQLIKNTHLTQEKTLKRKLREWKLTRLLEKKYSKDEILEKYLNTIYFGHNCFGIRSATEFYFGKSPETLTLAESALLAGLIKSPNNYSPFKNPTNCQRRRACVLSAMLRNGSISAKEKQHAEQTDLPITPNLGSKNIGYLHFVFDELTDLSEKEGFKVGGKIEIFTQLDQNLQAVLDNCASTQTNCDKRLLSLDTKTLAFKACASSVGNIPRLPGSLIKPLLVYAPAFEENVLSPATPILDEKIHYSGYSPENYNGVYHGYVSARECVEQSLNIPAVKVLESVGVKKATQYLRRMSLQVPPEDETLALALGGMQNGFTLQELTSAYATFANGGAHANGYFITKIRINGKTVFQREVQRKNVFSEETAYLMTDVLKSTAKNGTAKKLRSLPFPIAAKTGTVGTKNGNTDAYALSYTTKDCVAVWFGNADNRFIEHTGGGTPCSILFRINEYLYNNYTSKNEKIDDFIRPKNVAFVALDKPAYYNTHTLSLADDLAPKEYRFSELFKTDCIPTKKSDTFSNPSILPPVLKLQDGTVNIQLNESSPKCYTYKIDRYDYTTHTTLYQGEYFPSFTDTNLAENKNYIYTIIPIYNGKEGQGIVLPTVTTKSGKKPVINDDEILQKEWWEY